MKGRLGQVIVDALPPVEVSISRMIAGLVSLAVALVLSAMLVLQHFGAIQLPGCGLSSGCAATLSSPWGNLLGWPVSFVGLAYFTGLTAAWTFMFRSGVSMPLLATVRLGAIAALAYFLLMLVNQSLCGYCAVILASNLVFWGIVERSPRTAMPQHSASIAAVAGFALVTAFLNAAVSEQNRLANEHAALRRVTPESIEMALSENDSSHLPVDKIGQTELNAHITSNADAKLDINARLEAGNANAQVDLPVSREPTVENLGGQAGRRARQLHRIGPAAAAARLVVFYDYQDAQCQRIDRDIQRLLTENEAKMSVTARHYPLCAECNFSVSSTAHPNACQAALAAEAAGLLKGNDGFWQMHRWLLEKSGTFTDEELQAGLVELGYDNIELFLETMNSPQVLSGVLADVVEAQSLEIRGTPTVLLNGHRLGGLQFENAIVRAVATVVEKGTSPMFTAEPDASVSAVDPRIKDTFTEQLQSTAAASTVRIVNTAGRSIGSGTIIALRDPFVYVLTAHHLVPGMKRVEVQTFSSESYPEPAGIYSYATVVATSESADLAIIRLTTSDPMPEPLPFVPLDLVPKEHSFPVMTVGYDGDSLAPSCLATEVIDAKRIRRIAGEASVLVWEVAKQSAEGRSGGSLVDRRGFVLGVASGISDGKSYFCHAEEIYRFLEKHGLQGLVAPIQAGPKK